MTAYIRQAGDGVNWVSWGPCGLANLNNFSGYREKWLSSVVWYLAVECGIPDKGGGWVCCTEAPESESLTREVVGVGV